MILFLVDIVAAILAIEAGVQLWTSASLFAEARAYLEAYLDMLEVDPGMGDLHEISDISDITDENIAKLEEGPCESASAFAGYIFRKVSVYMPKFLLEAMACPYCFTYHVALWVVVWMSVAYIAGSSGLPVLAGAIRVPVYVLAAARCVHRLLKVDP